MHIKEKYQDALSHLMEDLKSDKSIIAIFLLGSMANDVVWEKSDIDIAVVVREQKLKIETTSIVVDDISIHIDIFTQNNFKRVLEASRGGSYIHMLFSDGLLIYTTDNSLEEYFKEFKIIGARDRELSILECTSEIVDLLEKCEKWLKVKEDLLYCQYYILKLGHAISNIELLFNKKHINRESILRARMDNTDFIDKLYANAMSGHMDKDELEVLIQHLYDYLYEMRHIIKIPIIRILEDGEEKTVNELARYFNMSNHCIEKACELLCSFEEIMQVTIPVQLTPKSNVWLDAICYTLY